MSYRRIFLIALLVLAGGLRAYRFSAPDLWYDEACMVIAAQADLHQIVNGAMLDIYPPLYFILLHVLLKSGFSTFWLRLPSLIAGTLSLGLLYLFTQRFLNRRTAWFALALAILHPFHFYYAREGKLYALLTLMVLAYLYCFLKLIEVPEKTWLWVGFGFMSALLPYTHYLAVSIPLSCALYTIFSLRVTRLFRQRFWLSSGAALLAFMPWTWVLKQKVASTVQSANIVYVPKVSFARITSLYYVFAAGYTSPVKIGGILAVVFGLLALRGIFELRRRFDMMMLFLTLCCAPPLFMIFMSIFSPMFMERYVIYSGIIYLILAAVSLAGFRHRTAAYVLAAALIAAQATGIRHLYRNEMPVQEKNPQQFFPSTPRRPFKAICQDINRDFRDGDLVLHFIPQSYLPCRYYLEPRIPSNVATLHPEKIDYIGFVELSTKYGEYPVNLWEQFDHYQRFWFVESYWGVSPQKEVPAVELNQFLASRCVMRKELHYADITVRLFEKKEFFNGCDDTTVVADSGIIKTIKLDGDHAEALVRTIATTQPGPIAGIAEVRLVKHDQEETVVQLANVSREVREFKTMWYAFSGVLEAERMHVAPSKILTWWLPVWNVASMPRWFNSILMSQNAPFVKDEPARELTQELCLGPGTYGCFVRLPVWPDTDKYRGVMTCTIGGQLLSSFGSKGSGPDCSFEWYYLGSFTTAVPRPTLTVALTASPGQEKSWGDLDRFYFVRLDNFTFWEAENLAQNKDGAPWYRNDNAIEKPDSGGAVMTVSLLPKEVSAALTAEIPAADKVRELWVRLPGSGHYTLGERARCEIAIDGNLTAVPPGASPAMHYSGFFLLGTLSPKVKHEVKIRAVNPSSTESVYADCDVLVVKPAIMPDALTPFQGAAPCFTAFYTDRTVLKPGEKKLLSLYTGPHFNADDPGNKLLRVEVEEFSSQTGYFVQAPSDFGL